MHLRSKRYDRPNKTWPTKTKKTHDVRWCQRSKATWIKKWSKATWIKFQNLGLVYQLRLGHPPKNGHISSNKFLAWTSSWNTLGTKTWKRSTEHRNPRKQLFDCNILFQVTWLRSRNKQKPMFKNMCLYIYIYGCFHKWWYPTTIGFPTKNDHFGVFLGYHYFRKHPYINLKSKYILYNYIYIYIHLPIPFTKHEIISVVTVAEWGSIPTYTYYLGYALLD